MSSPFPNAAKPAIPRYFNREISWLDFNTRVLAEAKAESTPTLEKLKFIAIAYNNLDEFFMVRVAGKKKTTSEGLSPNDSPDSSQNPDILGSIRPKTETFLEDLYRTYDKAKEELLEAGVGIVGFKELKAQDQKNLKSYFHSSIYPILTPLAVDPAHPFPFLTNLTQYLLIEFKSSQWNKFDIPPIAFVEVPHVLPRFVKVETNKYILLEEIISQFIDSLFWGLEISGIHHIRVTRDLDISLLENEVVDLLQSVQNQVKARDQAKAIRCETSADIPSHLLAFLLRTIGLQKSDVYEVEGPVGLNSLFELYRLPLSTLKFEPFNPRIPSQFRKNSNIFSIIQDQDILLHHPFESFYTVIEFLRMAARDPKVLAIKQTLYRTSGDSPIIDALIEAVGSGKQVTAVVELKARFDEKNNITWARRLERAGVNVVYGFIGLKTHSKAILVVRQEHDKICRYCHLSTGNYNSSTAKVYTDVGLITADPDFGRDISELFNLLTGFNVFTAEQSITAPVQPQFRKIFASPLNLRERFIALIDAEIEAHRKSGDGLFIGKFNALVDKDIIDKLYEASQAGVTIQLIIRGICCLIPGVKGLSENIEVRSIVDRFLEHTRIYYFHHDTGGKVYLSSADLMPRNLDRRIEIMFPILNDGIRNRILNEIMATYWQDNVKSKRLVESGGYEAVKRKKNEEPVRAQYRLIEFVREKGIKSLPYETAIWHNPSKEKRRPIAKRDSRKELNLKGKKK
ncbi:MAG: polyphosphate kinase 1 [Pseudobacteriovorax sp.]|nr:polyphosphate kinase 1 [Pseudobacteriovorax sp.]